jgi:hypothetical protein
VIDAGEVVNAVKVGLVISNKDHVLSSEFNLSALVTGSVRLASCKLRTASV